MRNLTEILADAHAALSDAGLRVSPTRRSTDVDKGLCWVQLANEELPAGDGGGMVELEVHAVVIQGHDLAALLDEAISAVTASGWMTPVAWSAAYRTTPLLKRDIMVDEATIDVVTNQRRL